jgi:thioredoxin reductase
VEEQYDVVIVGGGAAGLSGALTLSRARRSVLVVDNGTPRNAPAGHVHNYLGREGTPPGELLAAGRAEVAGYGGEVVAGEVVSARPALGGFVVDLADGRSVQARRVLVLGAAGARRVRRRPRRRAVGAGAASARDHGAGR